MSTANAPKVRLPIDHLTELWPNELKKARMGAVLHPASVNKNRVHTAHVLKALDGKLFQLRSLFGPQHGFLGETQDNMIEWQGFMHPLFKLPVYSLYGDHREPTQEMLEDLDVLLIDMQDVGARYYTFMWTLYLCMKACEKANVSVLVLDRPNPINGIDTEGELLDKDYTSFVGLHPIPARHGKTMGELAKQFQAEAFPEVNLLVLEMEGWERDMFYDETGLPWILPSPNMPTLDTAIVYPGQCLLEATNVSEARGTTLPFELMGAPWIRGEDFSRKLNGLGLPGVFFREAYFQPTFHKYSGELCHGTQFHVTDRKAYKPLQTSLEVLKHLVKEYPNDFEWKKPPYEYEYEKLPIEILLGGPLKKWFD